MDNEKGLILFQVEIPEYIEKIMLSKQRRAKYYTIKGRNVPKKYLNKNKYSVDKSGIIIDKITSEKVLSNPRSVGTPKMMRISGQDVWAGMPFMLRGKMARDIKSSLEPYFNKLSKINEYPIGVALDFYKQIGRANWDIDNHSLVYRKCVFDCLKDCEIIEDDSVKYITSTPTNYYNIGANETRKLVITIYKN